VYGVIAHEERDIGTVDLLGYFLQTKTNEEDKPIIIKITGTIVLLLVEVD
jgi:hypothetical protein